MDVSQILMTMAQAAQNCGPAGTSLGAAGGNLGLDCAFNVTGFVNTLSGWMTGLIPTGAVIGIGYHSVAKSAAQDEQMAAQHNKSIRGILTGAAIGTAGMAIIKVLSSYRGV